MNDRIVILVRVGDDAGQPGLISMISGAVETQMVHDWRKGFDAALYIRQYEVRRKYQMSIQSQNCRSLWSAVEVD
jgi:hypothetical protein